jgi:hypothetical protein
MLEALKFKNYKRHYNFMMRMFELLTQRKNALKMGNLKRRE